jgi:putative ABC transport system permease protein
MEGFYLLEGHAKPVAGQEESGAARANPATEAAGDTAATAAPTAPADANSGETPSYRVKTTPLPLAQREITAMLVKTSPLITRGLSNTINEGPDAQAVFPVGEITRLFNYIVAPFQRLLLVLTAMICIVSGISILVSIYNSMNDRRREIAIMRSLGAGRRTVMFVILCEAIILAIGGGFIGWFGGHALIGLAAPWIEAWTGVTISPFQMAPAVNVLAYLSSGPMTLPISTEWILVPGLMILAVVVGFLPALAAYRTDVAAALTASP